MTKRWAFDGEPIGSPISELEAIIERANQRYRQMLSAMNVAELAEELERTQAAAANIRNEIADGSNALAFTDDQAKTFDADAEMVREEMQRRRPN